MSHRDQVQKKFNPGAKVKAIFNFHGTSADDLSFKKDEVLTIVKISRDPNWYLACNSKGKEGMVPANHLESFSEKKEVKLHAMPPKDLTQEDPGRVLTFLKNVALFDPVQIIRWFHGKITREKAEELMHPPRNGTFLVRESTHFQGDYSLSVSYKNTVEHYRIIYSHNQLTVDEESYFENLFQLVEHYQKDADGLCCKLEYPLQKKGSMNVAVDSKSFIESGWAIERDKISFTGTIASGNFGDVREGLYQGKKVAIKLLKDDDKAAQSFLAEASVMTSLKHPNLVQLLGVVLGTPLLLVMEYMSKGNLVEYLRSRGRSVVTTDQLLQFSMDCAKGMAYLEKKNLVHRDLAARNILISEEDKAKVSDFGLTAAAEHMQIGKELPIRWTAPESLDTKEFTTKSDVWSFGILLWEVYSYGKVPYPRVPLADIRKFVSNNYRMEPPEGCPPFIYSLMKDCWKINPKERPSFQQIERRLESVQGWVKR